MVITNIDLVDGVVAIMNSATAGSLNHTCINLEYEKADW